VVSSLAEGRAALSKKRVAVRVEELTLSNTLQLTAIVDLLEERGILKQSDVLERMRMVRDRKRPS
jgi:hypothetical protein